MGTAAAPTKADGQSFHFDPNKPRWLQVVWLLTQIFGLLGGLALTVVSMFMYPMLLTGSGYAVMYLGPAVVGLLVSFLLIPRAWFPAGMSGPVRFQIRLGIGLFGAAWFIGIFGIVNGYGTSSVVLDEPMVYRRTSTPSDPRHMSYYVGTRVWPSSRDVYEIIVRRPLYDSLDLPVTTRWHIPRQQLYAMPDDGLLRLSVGRGRLGVDWLQGVVGAARPTSGAGRQL